MCLCVVDIELIILAKSKIAQEEMHMQHPQFQCSFGLSASLLEYMLSTVLSYSETVIC